MKFNISKKNLFLLALLGLSLFLVVVFLLVITIFVPKTVFAFPGAEGFGAYVEGGRGGAVYHVTTLEDGYKPGTLRYAVSQKGRRTVVFDISGVISLNSPLEIKDNYITIAGQTAPGKGICIKNYPLIINADNVIIRYLRFRLGEASQNSALIAKNRQRIMIDHCSISWSTMQNINIQGNALLTMQWCIISEALNRTAEGYNGAGAKLGGLSSSFHHNLFVSNARQNPYFENLSLKSSSFMQTVDFRNNVIINWEDNSSEGMLRGRFNLVNNYYKSGPASLLPTRSQIIRVYEDNQKVAGKHEPILYLYGNFVYNNPLHTNDNWMGVYPNQQYIKEGKNPNLSWRQFFHAPVTLHSANRAFKNVLRYAGASNKKDDIDIRLVLNITTDKYPHEGSRGSLGGIIDSPSDVGGYTKYNSVRGDKDTDGDGMPDRWERRYGLNPNNANDGVTFNLVHKDYTNLEVYLNSLVEDITTNQNKMPMPSKDLFWLSMLKLVNFLKD
ncbi:MAG: hypothetical protein KH301_05735 [Brachyspira sp.]|nr:hypothetical protein [Brachyspira sp.]